MKVIGVECDVGVFLKLMLIEYWKVCGVVCLWDIGKNCIICLVDVE